MDAFTCQIHQITDRATPKRILLLGDKHRRPEPAQHAIEFPGGAIELSRTTEGLYWAHILINRDWGLEDMSGYRNRIGRAVGSRIDFNNGFIHTIPNQEQIHQIAVLVGAEMDPVVNRG